MWDLSGMAFISLTDKAFEDPQNIFAEKNTEFYS